MKNISFLQLVLGTGGALMIYAGIKDLDLVAFFHALVTNPATAFTQGGYFATAKSTGPVKPSSNTDTGGTTPKKPLQA